MTQIQCLAAVAKGPGKALSVEKILVDAPKAGEIRIKVCFSALCATDKYTLDGHDPEGVFPCILGHEGSGVVESVGKGVTSCKIGDHVIPLYIPQCRKCEYCMNPNTNLCSVIRETQGLGLMPDNTTRFSFLNGEPIYHFMGTSVFSQYAVVPEIAVAKIDSKAPLDKVCLLSCGVATGLGAVINNAKVEPKSTVAIWGAGAVGLAVIISCKKLSCSRIFVIDVNPDKEKLAKSLGATDFINPKSLPQGTTVKDYLVKETNGGLDYTFECVGHVDLMREALEASHKGWGVSTIIGVAGSGQEIHTRPFQLVTGRTWKGSAFGGWKSRDSVPKLVEDVEKGELNLDPFITNHFDLQDINKAVELMNNGKGIRSIIKMWP